MSNSSSVRKTLSIRSAAIGAAAILLVAALAGMFTPSSTNAQGSGVFAQLSSLDTQQPSNTNPAVVTFDQVDGLSGMGFESSSPTDIVVQTAGAYFVIAAAQVGKNSSGANDDYVDLWIRVNGADVGNSNTRQTISDSDFTAVLVSQGVVVLSAGDRIQVAFSASDSGKGLGIIATEPNGEPAIPSIILSAFKLP